MAHKIEKGDLAGFDLYGKRQEDGSIEIGHTDETTTVDEWPESATIGPEYFTFTLEWVKKQTDDGVEKLEPEEAKGGEPGLEWAIYV